jgi:hypothetical protein
VGKNGDKGGEKLRKKALKKLSSPYGVLINMWIHCILKSTSVGKPNIYKHGLKTKNRVLINIKLLFSRLGVDKPLKSS